MATLPTEMIVLCHTKCGENSIVLHTISQKYGRRGFLVKVGKSTAMSRFLPLNIIEADISESTKSNLWRASHFVSKYPLNGIRSNIFKNSMTMFLSEVLFRVVKDGANEEGMYDSLVKQILTLDALGSDWSNFHLWFLLELCSTLGFSADFDGLSPFAGERMMEIEAFLQSDFAEAMLIPLNGQKRSEIAEIILRYIEYHTESAINIRSLKVLHELFE